MCAVKRTTAGSGEGSEGSSGQRSRKPALSSDEIDSQNNIYIIIFTNILFIVGTGFNSFA